LRRPLAYLQGEATSSPAAAGRSPGRPGSQPKEAAMAWIYLSIAGVLEIVWAFAMKQSHGFTRPAASIVTIVAMIASFALLSMAMKSLPLGTAYTIWTGIGAVGAFVVGIIVLGEQVSVTRIAAAVLIVGGLLLMKLSSPDATPG
jgi:quaternary ammonium compound-resistance protein SugE